MEEEQKPKPPREDAFGMPRAEDGKLVAPTPAEIGAQTETAPVDAEVAKAAAAEIEKHPVVVSLKKEIETLADTLKKTEGDKGSMGKSLSAMRKTMDEMKARLEKGDKTAIEPVFKEVKRVKDYTKEEQLEMSDTEKRLIENNADMMERINKMASDAATKEVEGKKAQEETERGEVWKTTFDNAVQAEARKLAGNDVNLANDIIKNFNMFAENEKLADEDGTPTKELLERLGSAARMIPTYKPPKEQGNNGGGTGSAAGAGSKQGYEADNDKIVAEVSSNRQAGNYSL